MVLPPRDSDHTWVPTALGEALCIREDGGSYQEWEKAGRTRQRNTSAGLGLPSSPPPAAHFRPPNPPESGAVPAEVAAGTNGHPETGQGVPLKTKRCLLSYHPFTHNKKRYMHF